MEKELYVTQKNNPGAVLNIDMNGLNVYKQARLKALNPQPENNEINIVKQELSEVKDQLQELKSLLVKVLESK